MKVFISGPMSGYEDFNRPAFMNAEKLLKAGGFDVFNPAWINVGWPTEDEGYYTAWQSRELLSIDIHALSYCDAIYHLRGWDESSGARLEHDYAVKANIPMLVHVMPMSDTIDVQWNGYSILNVPEDTPWNYLCKYMQEHNKTFGLARTDPSSPVYYPNFNWDVNNIIPNAGGDWIYLYEALAMIP